MTRATDRAAAERAETGALSPRGGTSKGRAGGGWRGLLWMFPGFCLLLVFSYWPPISAFYYSLTDWGMPEVSFIGFANFSELFRDPVFFKALGNAVIITCAGLVMGTVTNIGVAELLFNLRARRMGGVYRFLLVLPMLVPGVVTMLLWSNILMHPSDTGFLNTIFLRMRVIDEPLQFLYGYDTVLTSIIFFNFPWIGGTTFLIYLAGLQGMSESVTEASRLDGCGVFRRFFRIDLFYLFGQIRYFVILGIINGLQNYSIQLLITKGGPGDQSMVPGYFIYQLAFADDRFGYASAIGVVMFFLLFAFTLLVNRLIRTTEDL